MTIFDYLKTTSSGLNNFNDFFAYHFVTIHNLFVAQRKTRNERRLGLKVYGQQNSQSFPQKVKSFHNLVDCSKKRSDQAKTPAKISASEARRLYRYTCHWSSTVYDTYATSPMTLSVKCFSSKWKIAFACSETLKNRLSGGDLGSAGGNANK